MKKILFVTLCSLMTCIGQMRATTVQVATFAELKSAIDNAANGDVIELTADIAYGQVGYANHLDITKSITLDGKGHTLQGGGQRQNGNGQYATIWINFAGSEDVDVTIKNINVINETARSYNDMAIQTRGHLHSLTLQNVYLYSYSVPLQIGGNHSGLAYTSEVTIEDSHLEAAMYYPILSWNKYNLTATNTRFEGWCSLYFKGVSSSIGSRGSVVVATNCQFNAPNVHSGVSNAFGMFVCEDDGISITLNNCSMAAEQLGDQTQAIVVLSEWAAKTRRTEAVSIDISGDNTYINGRLLTNNWAAGAYNNGSVLTYDAPVPDPYPLSINISGGTYAFNPEEVAWLKNTTYETEEELYDETNIGMATIPDGYEVKEITTQQGELTTTLYRVRQVITTSYSINDDAEGAGEGQNENTQFLISGGSTEETVAQDEVVAYYVEVSDTATLTIPEGKTLEVTNGLDVTDGAQVVVEAGSTLIVGEGGVTAESTESIVIESSEDEPASFLLDPAVIVNTTPNLTVKMIANAGKDGDDWYWHRFAMPVNHIDAWTKQNASGEEITVPTYLQGWNYTKQEWESRTISEMIPFLGYTLTYEEVAGEPTTGETQVVYVFKGNLVGNMNSDLLFQAKGYNFFGNSYTAYIDAATLLAGVMDDPTIGGSVYMWDQVNQTYNAVTIRDLRDNPGRLESFEKEVAPMQTFVLQLKSNDMPSVGVDYASAIWGNPRYNRVAAAPARNRMSNDDAYIKITATAASGKSDAVRLTENSNYTDEYENGADADKFMNAGHFNFFCTLNSNDYTCVVTNNLEGKMLSLQTLGETDYTLSFSHVEGNEYAIKDMLTGAVTLMSEGNTYSFTANANDLNANRFMIVSAARVPTSTETINSNATAAEGIYNMMGMYVGATSDFNMLPAGVYVVDGVKVAK